MRKIFKKYGFRGIGIYIWYSDLFRIIFIFLPCHFIITIPLLFKLIEYNIIEADFCRIILSFQYIIVFCIGLIYNDYSNLRKIGLNEYHEPLKGRK